jgi:hypothetical protein
MSIYHVLRNLGADGWLAVILAVAFTFYIPLVLFALTQALKGM